MALSLAGLKAMKTDDERVAKKAVYLDARKAMMKAFHLVLMKVYSLAQWMASAMVCRWDEMRVDY